MAVIASLLLGLGAAVWGLDAAAGKVDITPDMSRPVYLAGFGAAGRRALGVHDPLYARLLMMREGSRTVALVGVDLLGLGRGEVEAVREASGFKGAGRRLFLAATHVHSGPDTVGLWGPLPGVSGVDPSYLKMLAERIAAGLARLEARLEPVSLEACLGRLEPRGLCADLRDPAVLDPGLPALRLRDRSGRPLATVVNWSCHPEASGRGNRLITADYPGELCAEVERGGGECLFLNGAIGGLLTAQTGPGRDGFSEARRIGRAVARAALRGLAGSTAKDPRPALGFRSRGIKVPVENSLYLVFLRQLANGRALYDAQGRVLAEPAWRISLRHSLGRLEPGQRPWVESEVSVVDIGPVRLLGVPGEIFPELVIGGYDGRLSFGRPLVKASNPAPPQLSRAPGPPYLAGLFGKPVPMLAGQANDELGYIVPEYDFKASPRLLMRPRPEGDHYEETNSLGPSAARIVLGAARSLLAAPR
ncbi:MAG: hypothetical protein PHF00_08790 [Elusimicrobia bacterium]|nr:hypothetical protein [Elusimicrobiota bacterium]